MPPLNCGVMRIAGSLYLLLLLLPLCACAISERLPTVLDQCSSIGSTRWKVLPQPPAMANDLMDVLKDGKSVRSLLGIKPAALSEAWLQSDNGEFRYCRYMPRIVPCLGGVTTVDFNSTAGTWTANGPLELICVADTRKH